MNTAPLFSLVIPVYNVEPYIRRCLESILTQSYPDWEAILVDDGSTDASGAICDEYAARDPRFRVHHKPNGGVSTARNFALDNARGRWIWFVDPDDWIADDALDILVCAITSEPCDTVISGINYYNTYGEIIGSERRKRSHGEAKDDVIPVSDFPPQNYLLSRDITEKYNLRFTLGLPMGEDLEYQLKYLVLASRVITIPDILYMCLRREGSAARNPMSHRRNADCTPVTLDNSLTFLEQYHHPEAEWLNARIRRNIKAVMSSNAISTHTPAGEVQDSIRSAIRRISALGYTPPSDSSIRLATRSYSLFRMIFKLYRLIRR